MQQIQLGIAGIAPNMEFEEKKVLKHNKPIRKKLQNYIRCKLCMDQSGFARMMGISSATITQWLYTERMPSSNVIKRMSTKLGLSYDEVYDLFEVKA